MTTVHVRLEASQHLHLVVFKQVLMVLAAQNTADTCFLANSEEHVCMKHTFDLLSSVLDMSLEHFRTGDFERKCQIVETMTVPKW